MSSDVETGLRVTTREVLCESAKFDVFQMLSPPGANTQIAVTKNLLELLRIFMTGTPERKKKSGFCAVVLCSS